MSKKTIILSFLLVYVLEGFSQSEQLSQIIEGDTSITELKELVITGTRFQLPIEQSGKTIYKLDAKAIEQNAGKTVADLLNEVPGIQMEGNFGTPGTNISIYARGGRNKNTLILIDGIPLNDPSGVNASYDLRLLPVAQIESIEVLKGGLSTLYGTGASAAVINIKLKEAGNKPIGGQIDMNYGSFNTYTGSGSINGQIGKFNYLLSGNYQTSDGFSAASDENATETFADDSFEQKNSMLKLGYKFNEQLSINGIVAYDDIEADYDGGAFFDAENIQTGNMLRFGITPEFSYNKGQITLKTAYAMNEREFESSFPLAYKGKNLQLDATQKHQITSNIKGVWGVNLQSFAYEQAEVNTFEDTEFNLFDPYFSLFFENNSGFNIHAGTRLNVHSEYGNKLVYNLNPSFIFGVSDAVRIKALASVATSYITPTGFQLFSAFGNKDLLPEESLNIEFGGALYIDKAFTLNLVYFSREETDAIDFVSIFDDEGNYIGGNYQNINGTRKVEGIEADISIDFTNNLSFLGNFTYVTTDDITTFYRIPKTKTGFTLNYSPIETTSLSLKYNYTGARTIFDFGSGGEIELDSYGLLDLYAQQKLLNNKLTVYGAVNNITDADFVSVFGFTTRGINYNLGLTYHF